MNIVLVALTIALIVEGIVICGLAVSVVWSEHRIWPPGDVSWRFWYYWGGSSIVVGTLAVVGYLDYGSFAFTDSIWHWIGTPLVVAGLAFAGWSGYTFRVRESFGLEGRLYTSGPYRYSRNPQYVGIAGMVAGVALIVNSTLLCVGLLPMFVWLWLLPRAEEPWLAKRFGEEYGEYRASAPRFLGIRTLRQLGM